ncbi:alcohol dehydrogenase catalytic domain-containing protein [Streptomyces sp. A0958]|uniref:alcohol dehydrogenase catalytic domain-containing protein n=1 Tax=Streptomyces sp. A0958 TaxID=2563101 RepID=UPI0023EF5573|nr:alcohol dehydrogenase catalytic domain-containing protein [Streptomyces sp. A0958]
MVRSYHVTTGGGIDGLSVRTHEPRTPGEGEVAVAAHATSLSFRELPVLRGQYVLPVKPDVIPVSDGAGEVVAVGPDVRRVRPGDRVTAALFPRWLDGPLEPAFLLVGGQAAALSGRRRAFLTAVAVFGAVSLLGALAPSGGLLVTARLLEGPRARRTGRRHRHTPRTGFAVRRVPRSRDSDRRWSARRRPPPAR